MPPGDLNLKKSWNPGLLRNQEEVWKREQEAIEERKKIAERQKEIQRERERDELLAMQEVATGKKRAKRLEWMYSEASGGTMGSVDEKEAYLLGRKRIDSIFSGPKEEVKKESDRFMSAQAQVQAPISSDDIARKVRDDPMLQIKKKQMEVAQRAYERSDTDKHRRSGYSDRSRRSVESYKSDRFSERDGSYKSDRYSQRDESYKSDRYSQRDESYRSDRYSERDGRYRSGRSERHRSPDRARRRSDRYESDRSERYDRTSSKYDVREGGKRRHGREGSREDYERRSRSPSRDERWNKNHLSERSQRDHFERNGRSKNDERPSYKASDGTKYETDDRSNYDPTSDRADEADDKERKLVEMMKNARELEETRDKRLREGEERQQRERHQEEQLRDRSSKLGGQGQFIRDAGRSRVEGSVESIRRGRLVS